MLKKQRCECCKKVIEEGRVAARVVSFARGRETEKVWCFTCWDNDEEAVEQYRAASL